MMPDALLINESSADILVNLLAAQTPDEDTFLTSPAYFQHTGRHGLWLIGDAARYLIYCQHPNQRGTTLIFPQPNRLDIPLWEDAARVLAPWSTSVTLARIHSRYRDEMQKSRFKRHTEDILDWRYPCIVLDNKALVEQKGRNFQRLREKLRRFVNSDVQRIAVTPAVDHIFGTQTRALIDRWALLVENQQRFTLDELRAPNHDAYDRALRANNPRFNAAVVVVDRDVVAFFTSEQPLTGNTVNGITMCVDRERRGAAELAHREMAALHFSQGFNFTNINGSESETLHHFRKKLSPFLQYEIDSYHLNI